MKGFFKKEIIDGRECLVPADRHTEEDFKKLKFNRWYKVEAKTPRNVKHTAKYFCLLKVVAEHSDLGVEEIDEMVRFKSKHYNIVAEFQGNTFVKTKRIAFHKMSQEEFEVFYDKALDVLIGDKLGLRLTKEQIDDLSSKAYSRMEQSFNQKVG